MKIRVFILIFLVPLLSLAQKTKVEGTVVDQVTGSPMPFVKVQFLNSKIGAFTDTLGRYSIETYYATDTLVFSFSGYIRVKRHVDLDQAQIIDVLLPV